MNSEKGATAYIAIVVMMIFLGIGIGINAILLRHIKNFQDAGDSIGAFYAAEAGIERILKLDTCMLEEVEADRLACIQITISNAVFTRLDCEGEPINDANGCRREAIANINPAVLNLPNGSSYAPEIKPGGGSCPGSNYCVELTGTFKQAIRRIEISR